jgi:hypothetical protein
LPDFQQLTGGLKFCAMESSLAAMRIALRVLAPITAHEAPAPADVQELRRLAPAPSDADAPLDEIACEVIVRVLQNRALARKETSG